jgi:tripartite-type tricarboxylate transporter receptor subunit TctC
MAFLAFTVAYGAHAQTKAPPYPAKPIRLIVPYPPGGPTDAQGRMLGEKLEGRLGQQVIIDNRGGAGGNTGMEIAARGPADGYTLVIATVATWAVNPFLYKLPYDVLKDFSPITEVAMAPGVLIVHPGVNATNVKELIALATEKPGELLYGSTGVGSFGHLSGELFTQLTKTRMRHVPYTSSAPAISNLLSGEIQVLFNYTISVTPHVKANRLRALATTGARRSLAFPDIPTIAESGVSGYENASWSAIAGPAGMRKALVTRLNREIVEILRTPDMREKHAEVGAEIVAGTPEQFRTHLKSELAKFNKVVKAAGIKPAAGT